MVRPVKNAWRLCTSVGSALKIPTAKKQRQAYGQSMIYLYSTAEYGSCANASVYLKQNIIVFEQS